METLRMQTDYLVAELGNIKSTLGNFVSEVNEKLSSLSKMVREIR
jgi:hypothetical protein